MPYVYLHMCRFVRKLKDRNVCCCKYDVEMRYLLDALRRVRQKKHEDCECPCVLCRPVPEAATCQIHDKVRNLRLSHMCTSWTDLERLEFESIFATGVALPWHPRAVSHV